MRASCGTPCHASHAANMPWYKLRERFAKLGTLTDEAKDDVLVVTRLPKKPWGQPTCANSLEGVPLRHQTPPGCGENSSEQCRNPTAGQRPTCRINR